jgi:uncharacterized repeat protein (TIGR01451 family)/LPXTG-motif cell wall-anchored protein
MSFLSKLRAVSARTWGIAAILTAVIAIPASLLAWGPGRATFTMANPASYVTFNSITDNPNIGDERNFVAIRESGTNGLWKDTQSVEAGKEYVVRLYVHNNAAANLNLIAQNVTAKVSLPTSTGKSIEVQGFINSSNATPTEVYDHATFTGSKDFNLAYVAGSLKYYNNANGNGFTIPESIFTNSGAKLGYTSMDGKIPGCNQYAGYLTFIVKPQFAPTTDFTVAKQVRKVGTTAWSESVAVNPGDSVEYMISYKNTGEAVQKNVVVFDTLPSGMQYQTGTTYLKNGSNPDGKKISDNIVTSQGINIGDYAPGAAAYVKFTAKVVSNDALAVCGNNTLTNSAKVTTDYGTKQDTADVTTKKTCVTPEKIQVCRLSDKTIVTINKDEFDSTKHSTNLSDCKDIKVCRLSDKQIVTISVSEYNQNKNKYSTKLSDCANIKVCRLSDKQIVTITQTEYDNAKDKYSTKLSDCDSMTVVELPETGAGDVIVSLLGLGSLTAVIGAYLASRRAQLGA